MRSRTIIATPPGATIKEQLDDRGMTQKEFSEKTGIPQSTMSSWRGKKQNPSMDKLRIICDTLGVDPYYLISGTTGDTNANVDYIAVYKSDEEYKLLIEYRSLDKAKKDKLSGYLQALRDSE